MYIITIETDLRNSTYEMVKSEKQAKERAYELMVEYGIANICVHEIKQSFKLDIEPRLIKVVKKSRKPRKKKEVTPDLPYVGEDEKVKGGEK